MKKIVRQDGAKKVLITEDGKEIPFNKITSVSTDEFVEKESKKKTKEED